MSMSIFWPGTLYYRVEKVDVLIPHKAFLAAKGKKSKPRLLPLNRAAQNIFTIIVEDSATVGAPLHQPRRQIGDGIDGIRGADPYSAKSISEPAPLFKARS